MMCFRYVGRQCVVFGVFFLFNDTATTEIYTLSLHDALPIFKGAIMRLQGFPILNRRLQLRIFLLTALLVRSEEHTSELQSRQYLVCRLLLEKKKRPTHSARAELRWT